MIVLSSRLAEARAYSLFEALGRKDWGPDEVEAVRAGSPGLLQSPDPTAVAEARRLVAVGLDLVGRASASDLPAVAVAAKAVLACHPEGAVGPSPEGSAIAAADLAAAIECSAPQLVTSVDQLRNAASQELSRRDDTWRPHALALAPWCPRTVA
jgi:hypothetical protein